MIINNEFVLYLLCFGLLLFIGRTIFFIFKNFLGLKWGGCLMVNIYTETPVVDVVSIIDQYFGVPSSTMVYDMAILFSVMIFFIVVYCILLLLFRK